MVERTLIVKLAFMVTPITVRVLMAEMLTAVTAVVPMVATFAIMSVLEHTTVQSVVVKSAEAAKYPQS